MGAPLWRLCAGFSTRWLLLSRSTGSGVQWLWLLRLLGCRAQVHCSAVVVHGLHCSMARGIFLDQGSNPCLLHWQVDSLPLSPPGKPLSHLLVAPGTPSQARSLPPSDLVIQLSPAACLLPTGPLCSILVGRFGCRATMMLGGVLASLGMVAGSFCRTLGQLYLTAGFITGDCHFILRVTG